ncbi:MAG TPA: PilT/PilU family type 4a pilus ATPase [Thermoanaerobaculia bacterium]|nr:PilT/PilU family type 4a pilus ATPase [Thermoanaerobaculia bacterium]
MSAPNQAAPPSNQAAPTSSQAPAGEQRVAIGLNDLLVHMAKQKASDLHLKPGRPPLIRVQGKLVPVGTGPLTPDDLKRMLLPILSTAQKDKFDQFQSVDIGYGVAGVARFRANLYMQRGTVGAVFRRIPIQVLGIDELELPVAIRELTQIPDGLVLVTGPTGSGKSTTLAAMISEISEHEPLHIVTIEDPMEFLFIDRVAAISQREVGTDTPNFKEALRNAMRQDPDVIMVGEMRDVETMETVLTAAETGHLVFSTLHTNNAAQTIDRVIDAFPPDQHKQIRSQFSLVLRGIISLKLIKTAEGKQTAAVEVLKNSPRIAKLIEDGHTKDILDEMEGSVGHYRMQSMNQSLIALLVHQRISYKDAMELASDPDDLSLKLRKLFPQIEERVRQGGDMAPSYSDFSQITELMDIKRLYEEQDVQWRQRLADKEEEIENLRHDIEWRTQQLAQQQTGFSAKDEEIARVRADAERLRADAQAKIAQLQERIKELNQKLMATQQAVPGVKR